MKRTAKTRTVIVIQNKNLGCKWEDETEYELSERKDAREDLKQYRESSAGRTVAYHLILRRVKNEEVQDAIS